MNYVRTLSVVLVMASCLWGCDDAAKANPETTTADSAKTDESGPTKNTKAAATSAPKPDKKPSELLVGNWRYESVELPGVPESAKKQIRVQLETSKLEFTKDKFTSHMNGKVFSSEAYTLVKETGRDFTLKMTKTGKQEHYEFEDDNTLVLTDKELGEIVLKREG